MKFFMGKTLLNKKNTGLGAPQKKSDFTLTFGGQYRKFSFLQELKAFFFISATPIHLAGDAAFYLCHQKIVSLPGNDWFPQVGTHKYHLH